MARLVTPALLFWGIGWLAWCWSERPPSARGNGVLTDLGDALQYRGETLGRLSGPERIAWIVAVLLAIAGSAVVAERLTAPFLGWIGGYWPGGRPQWLWRLLVRLARWRRQRLRTQWGRLRRLRTSSPQDTTREATLAGRLHGMPPDEAVMPTALTRGQLDAAGRGVLWALAAAVWSVFVWWIALVAVALAVALYRGAVLSAARVYADLVEAAFDLHRPALYDALRLQRPAKPADEPAAGQQVTDYLWEGYLPKTMGFDDDH